MGDSFFWWLNIEELNVDKTNQPFLPFNFKQVAEIDVKRYPLTNLFDINKLPAKRYSLWFYPSNMIDLQKKIIVKGERKPI